MFHKNGSTIETTGRQNQPRLNENIILKKEPPTFLKPSLSYFLEVL